MKKEERTRKEQEKSTHDGTLALIFEMYITRTLIATIWKNGLQNQTAEKVTFFVEITGVTQFTCWDSRASIRM